MVIRGGRLWLLQKLIMDQIIRTLTVEAVVLLTIIFIVLLMVQKCFLECGYENE